MLAGGILALSFVPYLPDGADGILHNVILYRSISVIIGLALLHRLGRWYAVFTAVTTVALVVVYAAFATYISWPWVSIMDVVWLVCIVAIIMIYRSARSRILYAPVGATVARDDQRLIDNEEPSNSP